MKLDPPTSSPHMRDAHTYTHICMCTLMNIKAKRKAKKRKEKLGSLLHLDVKMSPLGSYTCMFVILLDSPIWRGYRTI